MTSQIVKRSAAPSRGLLHGAGRDWVAGAVLLLVWTALWTVFTAGVLAPASGLGGRTASTPEPGAATAAWVAVR